MRAAFVVGHCMKLVNDQRFRPLESASTALGCQEDVERFWSGDEYVRRLLRHLLPLALRSVSGSHRHANVWEWSPALFREVLEFAQGAHEVASNIVRERP